MPKVSREHQENRRRQIIGAALRCFSQKGFHQTSMQDIVAESGLSPGAIYLYFKSKDEILQTAADIRHRDEKELFSKIFAGESSGAALSQIARHFFYSLRDRETFLQRNLDVQLWGEAMVNPDILRAVREGYHETRRIFAEMAAECQRQGKLPLEISADAAARVMLALFEGFVLQTQLDAGLDIDEFVGVVQKFIDISFAERGGGKL